MTTEEAALYVRLNAYRWRLEKTRRFIDDALSRVSNPYVACSFGKDSGVMLDLVRQVHPEIPVIFISRMETRLIDNYEEVIKAWGDINLLELGYIVGSFDFSVRANNHAARGGVADIADRYDSYFVGLRAQESRGRRITLKHHGDFYPMRNGMARICPMAWWLEKDVAAYTLVNQLPLLSKYRNEGFAARTTAGISALMPEETLAYVKKNDIGAYNQLLKLFPDAAQFS